MVDQEEIHRKCNSDDPKERIEAADQLSNRFRYLSEKKQIWQDLHRLTSDQNSDVRWEAAGAIGTVFGYIPDKGQAWKDLYRLTSDQNRYVRQRATGAIGTVFGYLMDKEQAWKDLIKLTSDQDSDVRQRATGAIGTVFEYVPDKEQAWKDLHRLTSDQDSDVRQRATGAIGTVFEYVPDKEQAWKDLHRLTSDQDSDVRQRTAEAIGTVFGYVPDKEQAWQDLHRLTSDHDSDVRQRTAEAIGTVFGYISDKEQAWKDSIKLISDQDRYVQWSAAGAIGTVFEYIPDKEQAWKDLHRLTSDQDRYVRQRTAEAIVTVFGYVPDKEQAWQDLHRLTSDQDRYVRQSVAEAIVTVFGYISDKEQAWQDLHRLTSDQDKYVRQSVAEAIVTVFGYLTDKEQAWKDLHRLTSDQDRYVRQRATGAIGTIFGYVPDKEQAWKDLIKLTSDQDSDVRQRATGAIGTVFGYVPDKEQAWKDLIKLTSDQDSDVRQRATGAVGTVFGYVPDKEQAWKDLIKLTSDQDKYVRVNAYHSLGRISIYKASQSGNEELYLEELKKAIEFFEKAAKEPIWDNPSEFCFPFYRSFYAIISAKKREARDEVTEYLSEAKSAIGGSKNKKLLFEAVENLSNALKEVQNLENMDLEEKKNELEYYRKYCEQASELMKNTEETAPSATKVMRMGSQILDRKLKSLLEEIQEKAKTACRESQGTDTEEIACAVKRKVQGWKAGSEEEIAFDAEDLLIFMKSNVPRFPENDHIFEKIKEIKKQKDLNLLLRSIPDLLKELPKIMIDPERVKPTIGIITALPKEYAAVSTLLENKNDKYKIPGSGAGRRYCLGEIPTEDGNKHNLVLVTVGMGNNIAATRASILLENFPNVKSLIMVGIAGGIPNPDKVNDHVRLGDIVVSNEQGVIQYDYIENKIEKVEHRNPPRPPSSSLIEAVRYLEAEEILGNRPWEKYIDEAISQLKIECSSGYEDKLYCSKNQNEVIEHPKDKKRTNGKPKVFIGPIASANILQKNPMARDELRERFKVKAIEMEASGIADATWTHDVGYLVVRGICDYCDSHKNDEWQQYAAVVAAAYTRALIESMP
ncbi:phosphorylase [Methanosarcina siciliae HI350]|uniref:Phosphorylase n=1 Tax=Methanosarcina siciliae HI350 TaxID=1434119 RepID=A0A0E3PGF0_9EURY|nr:HEAT repeat domain-containing protein [Methanosarcina siciliae]AKB33047.1 phosphorylase [Methanosarcina siciliae HI350]